MSGTVHLLFDGDPDTLAACLAARLPGEPLVLLDQAAEVPFGLPAGTPEPIHLLADPDTAVAAGMQGLDTAGLAALLTRHARSVSWACQPASAHPAAPPQRPQ